MGLHLPRPQAWPVQVSTAVAFQVELGREQGGASRWPWGPMEVTRPISSTVS